MTQEFEAEEEPTNTELTKMRGKQHCLADTTGKEEYEEIVYEGKREEISSDEDWNELTLSYIEICEYGTPSKGGEGEVTGQNSTAKVRGPWPALAGGREIDEVCKGDDIGMSGTITSDEEWNELALSVLDCVTDNNDDDDISTRTSTVTNVRGQQTAWSVGKNDDILERHDDDKVGGSEDKPSMEGDPGYDIPTEDGVQREVEDIIPVMEGMIITDGINVRGAHADLTLGETVVRGEDQVDTMLLSDNTHHHNQVLPVGGSGVDDKTDRVCKYVEGVCDIHGPATEKWRGGREWGKKKNGLYGWKYARKTYFVCEKRKKNTLSVSYDNGAMGDDIPAPEPTFIYLSDSKDRLSVSQTFSGGSMGIARERFRDTSKKSGQPAPKGTAS